MRIVPFDHQPERKTGLTEAGLHRVGDGLLRRLVGDSGANPIIRGNQHQLRLGRRSVECLTRRAVQKRGAHLFRHGRQARLFRPVAQCRGVAGKRQAALDEKADEFLGRTPLGSSGRQKARRQQNGRADQRRSSIWIGPSRRP